MNSPILDRFMQEARAGADVWYMPLDELNESHGFLLYEPTPDGKPWMWIGGPQVTEKLLQLVPHAMRVWFIPGEVGAQFLEEHEAQP